jgi:hypothetical protein
MVEMLFLIIWKISSGNDIVDKNIHTNEITFDNIWGVCDEDMYNKAIE